MLISVGLQRPHNSWRLIRIWEVSVFAGCFHLRSNKARLSCLIKTMWKQMVLCTVELQRNEFGGTEASVSSHSWLPIAKTEATFPLGMPTLADLTPHFSGTSGPLPVAKGWCIRWRDTGKPLFLQASTCSSNKGSQGLAHEIPGVQGGGWKASCRH